MSSLQARVRQVRFRVARRAWEYRQRNRAKGTWHRLRRLLADAQSVSVINDNDARLLLAQGHHAEPVGSEIEPGKTMIFVSAERLSTIASREDIPVWLSTDFLAAQCVALVCFGKMVSETENSDL